MARLSTWFVVLVVTLALPRVALAQFEPELTTSFSTLESAAEADLSQSLTLNDGDENFSSLLMSFDVGSFDFSAVDVDDSVGSMEIVVESAFTSPNGTAAGRDGEITADIVVTYTDDAVLEADVIVTEADEFAIDAIEDGGGEDPTDETVFTILIDATDLTIELVDTALIPSGTDMESDIEITWELLSLYSHADSGETLTLTTDLTSTDATEFTVTETFDLDGPAVTFMRGDVDASGSVSALLDSLELLNWAFAGGDEPLCMDAADVDDSGTVSALLDSLELLNWAFAGGDTPPDPGPTDCGTDPADPNDALECETPTC